VVCSGTPADRSSPGWLGAAFLHAPVRVLADDQVRCRGRRPGTLPSSAGAVGEILHTAACSNPMLRVSAERSPATSRLSSHAASHPDSECQNVGQDLPRRNRLGPPARHSAEPGARPRAPRRALVTRARVCAPGPSRDARLTPSASHRTEKRPQLRGLAGAFSIAGGQRVKPGAN
jgi:hypothetical protein